ncbi:hypothetical protein [Sphingopyxis sp.]|uniref:hypothetical protein n=1 Tax=Sphingopyxis sp. TaxID=1908224 RepID=UPI001DAB9B66|nr:hypothetical protein [Sphingopyxis sp.]MBW8296175.1 hypothetical protein [Sphingopyxis sp.]
MLATLSPESIQRSIDIADWTEANLRHRPFWLHPEYLARFAASTDAELRAAARIIEDRNVEREREIAALEFLNAGLRILRLGATT